MNTKINKHSFYLKGNLKVSLFEGFWNDGMGLIVIHCVCLNDLGFIKPIKHKHVFS